MQLADLAFRCGGRKVQHQVQYSNLLFLLLGLLQCAACSENTPHAASNGADAGQSACMDMAVCDAGSVEQPGGDDAGLLDAGQSDAGEPLEPDSGEPHACSERSLQVAPRLVDVMFAVSGSDTMSEHWASIRDALEAFAAEHPQTRVGLHLYWVDEVTLPSASCGTFQEMVVLPEPYVAGRMASAMGSGPPIELSTSSALNALLDRYLDQGVAGLHPDRDTLLVPITNSGDACTGAATTEDVKYVLSGRVATDLQRLHITTLPIALGARAATAGDLTGLARRGGSGRTLPLSADDALGLTEALDIVAEELTSCRFSIAGQASAFPSAISVSLDGAAIARDATHAGGWDFENESLTRAIFHGEACDARREGKTVTARIDCQANTCTDALLFAERQPRSVYVALDGSGSMGSPNVLDLTLWRRNQAASELARMLGAPSFDAAQFALDLFTNGVQNVCGPEESVDLARSHILNLLKKIEDTEPAGGSSPGRAMQAASMHQPLLDPGTDRTVLLIGDGPDSCLAGEALSDALASTSLLSAQGVQSYAVRFAPDTDAAQAAQFDQVAVLGGTDAHRQAADAIELRTVLGVISAEVTSCTLRLKHPISKADAARASIYFGGRELTAGADYTWSENAPDAIVLVANGCTQLRETYRAAAQVELRCP